MKTSIFNFGGDHLLKNMSICSVKQRNTEKWFHYQTQHSETPAQDVFGPKNAAPTFSFDPDLSFLVYICNEMQRERSEAFTFCKILLRHLHFASYPTAFYNPDRGPQLPLSQWHFYRALPWQGQIYNQFGLICLCVSATYIDDILVVQHLVQCTLYCAIVAVPRTVVSEHGSLCIYLPSKYSIL